MLLLLLLLGSLLIPILLIVLISVNNKLDKSNKIKDNTIAFLQKNNLVLTEQRDAYMMQVLGLAEYADKSGNTNKLQQEINRLQVENTKLRDTNERKFSSNRFKDEQSKSEVRKLNNELKKAHNEIDKLQAELKRAHSEIDRLQILQDELNNSIQDIKYEETNKYSIQEKFKDEIHASYEWGDLYDKAVKASKTMVKENKACIYSSDWTVNGSKKDGEKMIRDYIKLIISSFDIMVDRACNYVRPSNFEKIQSKVIAQFDRINKLNSVLKIRISQVYLKSKLSELEIICKYKEAKEEERAKAKEVRRVMMEQKRESEKLELEEKKLQAELDRHKEIEEAKLNAIQEQLKEKQQLLNKNNDNENEIIRLREEIESLEKQLSEQKETSIDSEEKLIEQIADIQEKQEVMQAGFVYVISNYGAFGENIFKIGVTRRTDPLDRINELGNASVPFKFNVHAIIPSEEAFKLESKIHKELRQYRVNLVNSHKEFFKIGIDELHKKLSEIVDNLEFSNEITEEQYLRTIDIRDNPDKFKEWLNKFTEVKPEDDIDIQIKRMGILNISELSNNKNYLIIEEYDKYFNTISEIVEGFSCKPVMRVTKYYMAVYLSMENNMKKLMTFYKSGDGKNIVSFSIYKYDGAETNGQRKAISIKSFDDKKYSSIIQNSAQSIEDDLIEASSLSI